MIQPLAILQSHQPKQGIKIMKYTAAAFVASPAFMEIATADAVAVVAKTNGQTIELTKKALALNVPNVVKAVADLVAKAAEHCATEANAGRLWK